MSEDIMYKLCGTGEDHCAKGGLVYTASIVEIDPVRESRIAEIKEELVELRPEVISIIGKRPIGLFSSTEQSIWDRNYLEKRKEIAPELVDELERLEDDKDKTLRTYVKVGSGPFAPWPEPFAEIPDNLVLYSEFIENRHLYEN